MRSSFLPAVVMTALLALSGCAADSGGGDGPSAGPSSTGVDTHSDKAEGASEHKPTADDMPSESAETSEMVVALGGKKITITPTDVYCSGTPGNIHHIIGKTHNGLPLVKAEQTRFVMVKLGHERPYKAENPSGVSYGENGITFEGTQLGSATLNGTMTCTQWQD